MKTLLFAVGLCAALVACGDSPEEHSTTNVTVPDYNPLPGGGGPGPLPCDRVYVIRITTEAGTFTEEVPVYCNSMPEPDHGDPPYEYAHYAVDPDPWDKQAHPSQTIREREEREQRNSSR